MNLADGPDIGPELSAAHVPKPVPSRKIDTQDMESLEWWNNILMNAVIAT